MRQTKEKMFKINKIETEELLNTWEKLLDAKSLQRLKTSRGYAFYLLIFKNIKESDFSVLYSKEYSAPNCPVNCLVSALILMHSRNWTYDELMDQISFNIEIRLALGLKDFGGLPFSRRTLFNFKQRLITHYEKTGENLIEKVFDNLTVQQIKTLGVKTSIQRGDTVLLESNIRSHTRLSLIVEVLRRLYKILSPSDQQLYHLIFSPYLKGGEHYIYSLKKGEYASHLDALAQVYYTLYELLKDTYKDKKVFQTFVRVYREHFEWLDVPPIVASEKEEQAPTKVIIVRPSSELSSDILQSPDDADATFRKKRNEKHQGYAAFGMETCHPDNELNIVTKLAVHTNNTDDAAILAEQLDDMKEQTPDLEEAHLDGGFGSQSVDAKAVEHDITIVQTAVKGPKAAVVIEVQGNDEDGYTAKCPNPQHPKVKARKASKNQRADFDLDICDNCPFKDNCPTKRERKQKQGIAIHRFKPQDVLKQKRHRALLNIPKERRTLRPGVENLMGLMHRGEKHTGKLKVRGLFNTTLYVFSMGIAINFERIFRYLDRKNNTFGVFITPLTLWFISCQRTFYNMIFKFKLFKCQNISTFSLFH